MRMFLDGLTNSICSQLLQLLGCENGQFVVISLTKVKCWLIYLQGKFVNKQYTSSVDETDY